MDRRSFLVSLAVPIGLRAAPRPNVVLIVADDLGWGDVSMNGCPDIRTPVIDSIAREGVRFTQFYANAPECTPTRCALLTGRYQQRVGGLECAIGVNNIGRYDEAAWLQSRGQLGLPASEITLPRILKTAGYDTACVGKWHLGYSSDFWPNRHGFDYSFTMLGGNADYYLHTELNEGSGQSQLYENSEKVNPRGYMTDLLTGKALQWLKQRTDRPFFLYLPFTAPHAPIQSPDDFDPKTGTAPYRNHDRQAYASMVQRMDQNIGKVLDHLQQTGAAANTLLIFMSDNGADPNGRNLPWRGRKTTLWEGGIRVPCAMRWPGALQPGGTYEGIGMSMDLLPTIAAAAGAPIPRSRRLDGIDLTPFLTGKQRVPERTVFWRYKRAKARRKAVRSGDWKYMDDSGTESLCNLADDPEEKQNLFSAESPVAVDLKKKLAAWEEDVKALRLRDFRPGG
jgi:N-acetylgalactosamine-6-sulfatase